MQDTKDLIDQGIEALITGDRPRARGLLQTALKHDPRNEQGWLALSYAVDKTEHALECVQRVLSLNPGHEQARERLADLQATGSAAAASRTQPPIGSPSPPPSVAPQAPAEPAQWFTASDALQATGEYFFFEPEAAKFVQGQTQTLPINGCLHVALIPFVLSGLLILSLSVAQWVQILTAAEPSDRGGGSVLGLCVGNVFWWAIILILAYYVLGRTFRRRRLAREGTLISGEIVQCSGRLDADHDFQFKAEVRFRSPQTGQLIYKTFRRQCNHLRDKPLPRPGTSIYILYIDDKTYDVL